MRIFTCLFFLSFGLNLSYNSFAQDTIYWRSDSKLRWEDFQGIPDSNSKYSAVSNPVIKYKLSANEDTFNIKVLCFFVKTKSWSKFKNSDTLLLHEQGHFDIAELFARKLRKAFSEYKFNYQTIGVDVEKIFAHSKMERTKMDLLYDKETNYSKNRKQQLLWNKRIKAEQIKLKKFAEKN